MTQSLAASALALASSSVASAQAPAESNARQFYELRRYTLSSGPRMASMTDSYVANALTPALNKLGIGPVGAFRLDYGPETPALYVLLPSGSAEALVTLEAKLKTDAEYGKNAAAFLNVSTEAPAFHRMESSILQAFEGFPMLHVPGATAERKQRIFQLRTYESPTWAAHERKIEMFHHGEFEFFKNAGCEAVFYSQTLIGQRMPSLTYMLTFKDLAALQAGWAAFSADPGWVKLKAEPRYSSETLVSNISNLVLSPTAYSQI